MPIIPVIVRKVKVLQVIDTLKGGGVENLLLNIVPHVSDAGIELCVLHLHNEADLAPTLRAQGVPTEGVCEGRFRWFRTPRAEREVRDRNALAHAEAWAPDIIHTHLEASYLYGPWLGARLGVPVVHTVHSAGAPWQIQHTPRIRLLRHLILREYARSSGVLCVGEGVRTFLEPLMGRASHRLTVVENCVGDAFAEPMRPLLEPRYDVTVIGRFGPEKNQAYTLDALACWAAEEPGVRAAFVGFGSEEKALREKTSALGLEQNVSFLGRLEAEQVRDVLDDARVFTMPSRFEGFGIAAAEALNRGLPCVLSDIPVFRQLFGDMPGVHLCPFDEPRKYARLLQAAAVEPRRDHRAALARFSPQRHVAQLKVLYLGAVEKAA